MTVPALRDTKEPNKLILCFDGTGNSFSGSNADTNVVKILNKLDRQHPQQFHYYQTGVGTYSINELSVHKTWLGEMRSNISMTIDQAVGTTFDAHVMAGYRFLMRHYTTGDKIYMFGFSRGAFTARFLARMVHTVGLLCVGNEELVPFAYRLYQRYLAGEVTLQNTTDHDAKKSAPQGEVEPLLNGLASETAESTYSLARNEIVAFSNTFCRKERIVKHGKTSECNVKVYFLGLWDCVNSVAVFEGSTPIPVLVQGTAQFIRHAVSVDERRVKFKPALIDQDTAHPDEEEENIKEVWFPGCHGDVGGGWPASEDDNLEDVKPPGFLKSLQDFWFTRKAKEATRDVRKDAFQLSDVALDWMIRELEIVSDLDPVAGVKWSTNKEGYKRAFRTEKSQKQAQNGFIHDSLKFGRGSGFFKVWLWKMMEVLPIISRWEIVNDKWKKITFPLNKGSFRDIPKGAMLHDSLVQRLRNVKWYLPLNNHGTGPDAREPCLKHNGVVPNFERRAPVIQLLGDRGRRIE
jgi:hypothetical protein